jgi:hypothetical protein
MKAHASVANGLIEEISDTLSRKLVVALNAQSILHAVRGAFRTREKHLSKQHAPRVESEVRRIGHAPRDQLVAGGAQRTSLLQLSVLWALCTRHKIKGSKP